MFFNLTYHLYSSFNFVVFYLINQVNSFINKLIIHDIFSKLNTYVYNFSALYCQSSENPWKLIKSHAEKVNKTI